MHRLHWFILLLATPAAGQSAYEEILEEAVRLERDVQPGERPDVALDRAYERLGEAARMEPHRWQAFAMRGANRCTKAVECREQLNMLLGQARARGDTVEVQKSREKAGLYYIERCIEEARVDFRLMHGKMKARGEVDPDRLRFAVAALNYAEGDYRDAIRDFKSLVERGWLVEECSEFVARCYGQLGVMAVTADKFAEAQAHWDEALRWVRSPGTKRVIQSNKAAAYNLDNEYGQAEGVIRSLIEAEPSRPLHWKNLGLILGHQNKLGPALHAYGRAREICRKIPILGPLHGNAWLKPAMIHGKLLERDGDLQLAWRLFSEYRTMLGDDYNFCLNFGQFLYHMRQYDLAWVFLGRARDIHPFCIVPHERLMQTAQRMGGPPAQAEARIAAAREGFREAQRRFGPSLDAGALKRLCGGLRDRDGSENTLAAPRIDPDPLPDLDPDRPPPWLVEAAALRQPFRAWEPGAEADAAPASVAEPAPDRRGPAMWVYLLALLGCAGAFLFIRRRR